VRIRGPLLLLLILTACSAGGSSGGGSAAGPDTIALTRSNGAAATTSWSAWPQAGHDARRSGSSPAKGPQTGRLRWTRRLEGNVTPGPVVGVDGSIIAASNAGVLHALDPATGQDRWTYDGGGSYGLDLSTSPAVLPDGTILWPGPGSSLVALSPTGTVLWKQRFKAQPSSPAVAADGVHVVIGDSGGAVTALEVHGAQHTVQWSTRIGQTSYGSVALDPKDPTVAYQSVDDQLVALHDGTVAWRFSAKDIIEVSAAVAPDGTVVVGSNDAYEYGVHPDGTQAWRYRREAQSYSSPIVGEDGIAWFGDHAAYVTAVDATTGNRLGRSRGESRQSPHGPSVGVWTSPLVDSAHDVYWGTRLGHVYGRAADGRSLFDIETKATVDSYPALTADGLLVVGVTDGRLLGIADS
jgi:outer membrane protein assembly factor BamB